MKILVYDVAAEHGGALEILKKVYEYAKLDKKNNWIFLLSKVKFENCDNISIYNYNIVKKSWFHRLFFDKFTAPKIIKNENPDLVLNLQNIAIKCKCQQYLYMHQSLPFIDYKFSIKHKKLFVYQNIIGRMIKKSCKKVDKIIIQTKWIRDAIIRECKIEKDKFILSPPTIDKSLLVTHIDNAQNLYIFPANGAFYKNHSTIVSACSELNKQGFQDYNIIFTLKGDENEFIKTLYEKSVLEKLNIEWRGRMNIEDIYSLYKDYGLIFSSYIETFGLPILEAKLSKAPILVAETPFSKEILEGYDKVKYFEKFDYKNLAKLIKEGKTND